MILWIITKAYYCAESGVYDAIKYLELMVATGSFDSSYISRNIPIVKFIFLW